MHERRSARLRITLVSTALFAAAFAGLAVLLVGSVRSSLERHARHETSEAVAGVASQLEDGVPPAEAILIERPITIVVFDEAGNVIAGGSAKFQVQLRSAFSGPPVAPPGHLLEYTSATRDGEEYTVAAASPLDDVRRSVDTVATTLWFGTPALVVLVGVIVWWLVGRALRPVALAEARQREFVSDASHELRSPIATMRTELEVARQAGARSDWHAVADRVLGEQARLEALVDDLLDLAKLDESRNGALRGRKVDAVRLDDVDLDELVLDEGVRRRPVAVDLSGVSAARVRGDRRLLARVVRNLLDNATRHAVSKVAVGVRTDQRCAVLTVDDDGPGVPEDEREHVFARFARLDGARGRHGGGTGLGLAVVRDAVERHGGEVVCEEAAIGGARFTVRLPVAIPEP